MPSVETETAPAEIYDERFVPAVFEPFAARLVEAVGAPEGTSALDIGCGTGALTMAVARAAGPGGRVVGLDPNPEMLAVARRKPGGATWVEGVAEALPFDDASFDRVVSQFAMMFFEDRPGALREAARVLRPGGELAFAVIDDVGRSPGYAALAGLLDRLFGRRAGDAFRAPFVLGDEAALAGIAHAAGLGGARVERIESEARFGSIADLVATERACVWTLGGLLDDDQFTRLAAAAETELAPWRTPDGAVRFSLPMLVVRWRRPE